MEMIHALQYFGPMDSYQRNHIGDVMFENNDKYQYARLQHGFRARNDVDWVQFAIDFENWSGAAAAGVSPHRDGEKYLNQHGFNSIPCVWIDGKRQSHFITQNRGELHRVMGRHGDIVWMNGRAQDNMLHGVWSSGAPQESDARFSLNFRVVSNHAYPCPCGRREDSKSRPG